MTYDEQGEVASRIYTTDQAKYPLSGRKPMLRSGWSEQVLRDRRIFVANTYEEFRPHYVDWEKLRDLGFGAAVNFLAVVDGRTVGTVNLLAKPGSYPQARVRAGEALSALAAVGFLLVAHAAGEVRR